MFGAFLLFVILCGLSSAEHPDEVLSLPGLDFPLNYRHYSGYLNATEGRFLHYWFVESQRLPSTDPVLLWLNGGPGCSSLQGILGELGPLHVSDDGKTLYNNTFSWNREANVLFLESPAGVGFSYSLDGIYATNDDDVSFGNYAALQHFFEKFPQYKKNDFYITGESYAGVYVPTLGARILNGTAKINLKGYAIGNGLLSLHHQLNSIVFFSYYHGFLGTDSWRTLEKHCCDGLAVPEKCKFASPGLGCIFYAIRLIPSLLYSSGINMYNVYAKCHHSEESYSRYLVDTRNVLRHFPTEIHKLGHTPPCLESSGIKNYLNQPEVRKALHVPDSVQEWDICSTTVEYGYKKLHDTVKPEILQMAKSGIRGLVYNGDVDLVCNFLGDMWFMDELGLKVHKAYDEWHYNNRVAGFVKYYENITFLTVKGAGHMVPQDKPAEAFHMITKFLNGEAL